MWSRGKGQNLKGNIREGNLEALLNLLEDLIVVIVAHE
jgi:hypothetical protein